MTSARVEPRGIGGPGYCSFVDGFGLDPGDDQEWRRRQVEEALEDNPANHNPLKAARLAEDFAASGLDDDAAERQGAIYAADRKYRPGTTIKVHFLDGPEDARAEVINILQEWSRYAYLEFAREKNRLASMMRITFRSGGSWSVMGNGALGVRKDQPTMQLGWYLAQRQPGVVRHEGGHGGLALIHEQQSPARDCKYNKPVVLAELGGPPNNWSPGQVEFNVFRLSTSTNFLKFDPMSVMLYAQPQRWFITPDCATHGNSEISREDKQGARLWYPSPQ